MSGSESSNDGQRREEQPSGSDEHGHTGEGAASALAHMISQGQRQRRHQPDGEDQRGGQAS